MLHKRWNLYSQMAAIQYKPNGDDKTNKLVEVITNPV